mmetsp:Transcript_37287/g.42591  ORF Transcript_37287/g.42591 Transcript_37287/m.42591 type:complete len:266 (+) Transcript_37287:143-940(+)|eukprot:CAMPEP_0194133758 /NCGR_PEP_ID=MMETSP0152-20130528/3793_1 /TAXON_ID=1049557 /ORGANISM="Thalassiothrix antarctica, Strain L6-D1" /LENGTH=265 /DNA_ID=CAMNT_0038829111 /DNA_START=34 /DNA_END=831 /DNA_ORIENTATION=+
MMNALFSSFTKPTTIIFFLLMIFYYAKIHPVAGFSTATPNNDQNINAKIGGSTAASNDNDVNNNRQVFSEIAPLRAAMLSKTWQGLMLDVEEKVGVVPELGSTSVTTRRSGPELPRRQLCKAQFAMFYDNTFALALADKHSSSTMALNKRKAITSLVVDGKLVGPMCKTYASLTQPASMALVAETETEWSILSVIVNPTERNMESIIAAECAILEALQENAKGKGVTSIRLQAKVREALAANPEQISLKQAEIINNDTENEWIQF